MSPNSVRHMLDDLEWPSLEAHRDQPSLLLFHKIYFGAMSVKKDKHLTLLTAKKIPGHHTVPNIVDSEAVAPDIQ